MVKLSDLEQDGLQVRRAPMSAFTLDDDGQFAGRAVPYGVDVEVFPGMAERFESGAFAAQLRDPGRVKIAYRHGEIVGRAVELEERPDGLWLRGQIMASDDRPTARQALADLRDGLIDELSVGFQQVRNGTTVTEGEKGTTVVHRKATLREVSVVPWGAYGRRATIKQVRDDGPDPAAERDARIRALVDEIAGMALPWASRVGPAAQ